MLEEYEVNQKTLEEQGKTLNKKYQEYVMGPGNGNKEKGVPFVSDIGFPPSTPTQQTRVQSSSDAAQERFVTPIKPLELPGSRQDFEDEARPPTLFFVSLSSSASFNHGHAL